jgi:hypothetical protein
MGEPHKQAAEEGLTIEYESPNLAKANEHSSFPPSTSLTFRLSRRAIPLVKIKCESAPLAGAYLG